MWRVSGQWPRCWGLQVSPHTLHHSSSSSHRRQTIRLACWPRTRTEPRDDAMDRCKRQMHNLEKFFEHHIRQFGETILQRTLIRSCEHVLKIMQILQDTCEYVWCISTGVLLWWMCVAVGIRAWDSLLLSAGACCLHVGE